MPDKRRRSKKELTGPTSKETPQISDLIGHEYVDSFFTTTFIYLEDGAARIPRCCLDSGYTGRGAEGLINPSVVDQFRLERIPAQRRYTLADGSTYTTSAIIRVPLTFQAPGYARTIDVELNIRNTDSSSDHILLSTGVQYALRGTHSHKTNPSIFTIMDLRTNTDQELAADTSTSGVPLWIGKQDCGYYLSNMMNTWAFLKDGWNTLPPVAFAGIGMSSHVSYVCGSYNYLNNEAVRSSCIALVEWLAACERNKYAELASACYEKVEHNIPEKISNHVARFSDAAAIVARESEPEPSNMLAIEEATGYLAKVEETTSGGRWSTLMKRLDL